MIVRTNKDQELCKAIYKTRTSGGGPTKQRACLRCGKVFESIGRGNRICPGCHLTNTQQSATSVRIDSRNRDYS